MNSEKWEQAKQLYEAALKMGRDGRPRFLAENSGGDEEVLREVESLLAASDEATGFLETPAIGEMAEAVISRRSLAGQKILQYQVLRLLGAGGMGEVYLAEDTKLDRRVAIKILPREFAEDAERMGRFVREAKSASALNHPNIITIHEIGETDNTHFIATEYIEGETLHRRLEGGPLDLKFALEIAIQIVSALDAAHRAGIVHRDVKPENVMIRPDGLIKVLDFGIAKLSEPFAPAGGPNIDRDAETVRSRTGPGMIIGTANYMSPEQALGKRVDARSDIFSLGIVLYEILTGKKAFAGENGIAVISSILKDEPKTLHQLSPELPHEIGRIVNKTLRKDRDERYQTTKELLIDLRDLKQELEFQNKLGRAFPPETRENKTPAAPATTAGALDGRSNLLKWLYAVAAILLISGVGYFVWYLLTPRNPFKKIELKALTGSGIIDDSAISPDGKWLALVKNEKGRQSLWIQQKEVHTSEIRLTEPSSENSILGVRFVPTGDRIYFQQRPRNNSVSQLFSVPILGGQPPQFILNDVDSPPAFSPDGSKFAFMRRNTKEGVTDLLIADSDGANLQEIMRRKMPLTFILRPLAWSPDGQKIAVVANDENDVTSNRIGEIDLRDKQLRIISRQGWVEIDSLAWIDNGSALVFSAVENKRRLSHSLWSVDYSDGEANLLTSDLNDYVGISVASKTGEMSARQSKQEFSVWTIEQNSANPPRRITQGNSDGGQGVSWADESTLVYTSEMNSLNRLQKISIDNGNPVGLTSSEEFFRNPCVSNDGKYIVFVSDRDNVNGIWRINVGGGNPILLTDIGGIFPDCSSDGLIYFNAMTDGVRYLWRVPVEGGEPQKITDKASARSRISPDGSKAAFYYRENAQAKWEIAVFSLPAGEIAQRVELPATVQLSSPFDWSADGEALIFIDTKDGTQYLLEINLKTNKKRPLTNFPDDNLPLIGTFAISPSGKFIAVTRWRKTTDVVQVVGN